MQSIYSISNGFHMNKYHKKCIWHIFLVELNINVPKSGHNNIQVFFCKLFSCGLWKVWKYFFLVLMYLYVDISYLMESLHDIKSGIYIMCPNTQLEKNFDDKVWSSKKRNIWWTRLFSSSMTLQIWTQKENILWAISLILKLNRTFTLLSCSSCFKKLGCYIKFQATYSEYKTRLIINQLINFCVIQVLKHTKKYVYEVSHFFYFNEKESDTSRFIMFVRFIFSYVTIHLYHTIIILKICDQ